MGLAALGVAAAAIAACNSVGRRRIAWQAVSAGLAGWLCADAFEVIYPLLAKQPAPFPSIADAGYLALPACICLALLLFPTGRSQRSGRLLLLDGLIVAGSILLASWVLILRHVVDVPHPDVFAFAVLLAYPVSDMVAVTVGLLVLATTRPGRRAPVAFLLAGIVAMAASNDAHLYLVTGGGHRLGGIVDLGWATSLLAFALAPLYGGRLPDQDLTPAGRPPSVVVLWLPMISVAMFSGIVAVDLLHPDTVVIVATSAVLFWTVLIRQYLTVGENRRLLAVVADQAMRDPLTGLANRTLFDDRLQHALALRRHDAGPLAVLSIDLDHFKLVNDRLGHPAGDALLAQVAERLQGCVDTGDTVARLGGDEFAILVENRGTPPESVAQYVAESFEEPFAVDHQWLFIRPSVGLATARADAGAGDAEALLRESDAAMYAAKQTRTSYVQTLTGSQLVGPDGLEPPPMLDFREGDIFDAPLLSRLRSAIEAGELQLAYQPQVALHTGEIVGVEALVRWVHPDRGVLPPAEFLPLIRSHGLMEALTEVVLAQAVDDAARWRAGGDPVPVSVNLFATSFVDSDLPRRVFGALSAGGLRPDCLTLEITEDLVLRDRQKTRVILRRLRHSGVRVSIDDFGTGYSDLSYLRELPIDEVKLDRAFILPVLDDPRATAIVRAVINLVHTLGMTCVAEGVENQATAERLLEFGCDVAQGYYYSEPVTNAVLLDMLSAPAGADSGRPTLPIAR